MTTSKIIVGAAAIEHVVCDMLEDNDIQGVAKILPDLTFSQAIEIRMGRVVFEGDSSEGIRLVPRPAD